MKNICILICFLATSSMSIAQSQFTVYGTGGMSNLNYKLDAGKVGGGFDGGIGFGFGINYTYNTESNFGITTGVGLTSYGGKATSESLSGEHTLDDNGNNFQFNYSIIGYSEKQSATLFTVPVMLQYRFPFDSRSSNFFVLGAGMKFGLPISTTTTASMEKITTSGHYTYEDQTYTDLPQHGFVSEQSIVNANSSVDFGFSMMASVEAGLHFSFNERTGLYTGLFIDYGVNNILKPGDKYIVESQPSDPLRVIKYNSILNTEMVNKINMYSVGIKLGVQFGK